MSQPKVNVEISEDLSAKLDEQIPHGLRKPAVNKLLWDLVHILQGENSELVISAILEDKLKYEDFSSIDMEPHAAD